MLIVRRALLAFRSGLFLHSHQYWACELPKPDIARLLIQAGADLNLTEQHGFTPLHLASWIGNEDMVQLLLEFRADLNRVHRVPIPFYFLCVS